MVLRFARSVGRRRRRRAPRGDSGQPRPRRVVLVGVDDFATLAIRLTDCQSPRTIQFVAALDPRPRLFGRSVNGVKIVGGPGDIRSVIEEYEVHGVDVDEVWIADELQASNPAVAETCEAMGLKCSSLAWALNLAPVETSALGRPAPAAPLSRYFGLKRVFDILFAVTLLCLLAPAALVVAVVVAVDVGTPVIFWQERLGRDGRKFLLYKFRTYLAPFDARGRPIRQDRRLTRLGRFLRSSRLDELPQLFNVLRGDMSLIGPRPLLPVDQPPDPSRRLMVRPGVTGWAQVNGAALVTADEKDALDTWYIEHASFTLDLRIALRTISRFCRIERRNGDAIETAVRWRGRVADVGGQTFLDRSRIEGPVSEALGCLEQA